MCRSDSFCDVFVFTYDFSFWSLQVNSVWAWWTWTGHGQPRLMATQYRWWPWNLKAVRPRTTCWWEGHCRGVDWKHWCINKSLQAPVHTAQPPQRGQGLTKCSAPVSPACVATVLRNSFYPPATFSSFLYFVINGLYYAKVIFSNSLTEGKSTSASARRARGRVPSHNYPVLYLNTLNYWALGCSSTARASHQLLQSVTFVTLPKLCDQAVGINGSSGSHTTTLWTEYAKRPRADSA